MQVLSLIRTVMPRRRSLIQRSFDVARRGAFELIRTLVLAILRRLERLIAPPPAPFNQRREERPAPREGQPVLPAPPQEIEVEVEPDVVDPGWIGGFLTRVKQTRSERERAAALGQTLGDLERLIPLLRRMDLGAPVDGLTQSYHQIQALTDPDRESSGFELNMAWSLLERELRATLKTATV